MIRMKIEMNNSLLEELLYILKTAEKGSLPNTAKAMEASARLIQGRWVEYATGKRNLTGVIPLNRPNAGYARSIRTGQIGAFEHEIYSEAKIAELIENGTEEHDMKKTHPHGPRSRVSKEGIPYLIIPFRWGTPDVVGIKNVMPLNVYNIVSKFNKMETLVDSDKSNIKTPNAQTPSKMVGRAQYNKGYDRLSQMDFSGTVKEKIRMNGMVRSTDETGKDRSGGYFTFRVISANSPKDSWIKPAVPARNVTRGLIEDTREEINVMVEAGIMGDVK